MKKTILLLFISWSQFSFSELSPSKITNYQVDYNPYKVLSYGACKVNNEYHVLMTVGLAIKSKDGINWEKYEAFKAGDVRMQGGPDLISCGQTPTFFSRDFGLFTFTGESWLKVGKRMVNPYSYNENNDRSIIVFYKEPKNLYVSSKNGWTQPEELSEYKENGFGVSYYTEKAIIFGIYTDGVDKVIKRLGDENLTRKISDSLLKGLSNAPFRVVPLGDNIYIYNTDFKDGVIEINKRKSFRNKSIRIIEDQELDLLKCVDIREDLSACHLYPSGVVFISLIEDELVFYKINAPKNIMDKKPNVVFGENEVLFEVSGSDETKDKELVLSGTITEYSYDSILEYMRGERK